MIFFKTLKKGAAAAASSYKLILLVWVTTLVLILAVGLPLRIFLSSMFGNSLAVERLNDGFDLGLIGDLGEPFGALMASVSAGAFFIGLAGFFLMTFFAGGLFKRFTMTWGGLKVSDFLKASAVNFVPFLKIALLMILITGAYTFVVIGIPGIVSLIVSDSSVTTGKIFRIFYIIWALGLPVWLFVADASRRWIAATGSRKALRALGAGFRAMKEKFWLSYGIVLAVMVLNTAVVIAILWFAAISTPEKGIMVFLFFVATQTLFIIRLFMKAWRYASVCEVIQMKNLF